MPSNALELALFLESDRMGYLLDTMTPERVNGQRDVVKNERRQSYENRPYGMASLELDKMLWPAGHPYSWPTIGHMEDLTAASHEDVVAVLQDVLRAEQRQPGRSPATSTSTARGRWSRSGSARCRAAPPVEPVAPPAARADRA